MEENLGGKTVESVFGCHVEDAITFWAQSISRNNDLLKTRCALAEICPQANSVFGNPDLTKVYGGCFSEDKCWYRCKILSVISDEKCRVLYIDYGNSEILSRSEIVEIPADMHFSSVAKKYVLWGLQIPAKQDLNQYDQGRKFLNSLIFEKEIKTTIKAISQDGTIIAQAECGLLDVGEEIAKKGFAEKYEISINGSNSDSKMDTSSYQPWNPKSFTPVWGGRINPAGCNKAKSCFRENMNLNGSNEKKTVNHTFSKEKVSCDFKKIPNLSLEKIKQTLNMNEEYEKLKKEKEAIRIKHQNLLRNHEELLSTIKKLSHELEKEKNTAKEANELLENTLSSYVGTTVGNLAVKFQKLRETRQEGLSTHFGEDLSEAVQLITEGYLVAPPSLEKLEKIWIDYKSSQEEIRLCECVEKIQSLITLRNQVQLNLYSVAEDFILEVDNLPLSDRLETLKKLKESLGDTYGETYELESFEGVFEKFAEWKNVKLEEFNRVRSATDSSLQDLVNYFSKIVKFFDMTSDVFFKPEEVGDNLDEVLKNAELNITQELNLFLTELDEVDKRIILNMYSGVMKKINNEECVLSNIFTKYLESVEFKKQNVEWLTKSPNVDDLLVVKKRIKNLKAQLRWKLAEKNNLEESDDFSESKMAKIKEEIIALRNNVFEEVYKEQEEYEKLKYLTYNWFPELPLLYPESGIQKYMYSRGLLTVSLEHDLLDAEPMRELSTKRPVVCSEVQGRKVLLKGYAVDVNTETEVIERAAKYHEVQRELKEKSGLMELMFLFLCKSDPLAYLMVPYYAETSLGTLQSTAPLTSKETLQVMKGVAQGLHALHGASIVHGSLHKNNVFAINRERGIVGDFDFTKSEVQRASVNYLILNGLILISPEVKQGQPPCPASDMYDYGCLLYWLVIGNQAFKLKQDGTPEIDGLKMDEKVKSLLQKLLCCDNRLTSEQVLNNDCFLLPEVIPLVSESEPPDFENKDCKTENEIVSGDIPDSETSPLTDNVDLTNFDCI